jgi:hypothetical protein
MLNRFIRNATAAARPVNTSGVAETTVSLRAPSARNAASNSRRNDSIGGWPVISSTRPETTSAARIDTVGTTTTSHHGCASRRSIRITIMCSRLRPP